MRKIILFIARALISIIFLVAAAGKLMNWQENVDSLVMVFSKWHMHLEGGITSSDLNSFLVSSAPILLGVALFLEVVGGLLLFLGVKVRLGALLLLMFLIPTTVVYHAFWFEIGPDLHREFTKFLLNLALIGGLLYIAACPTQRREVG
ncbi:DoxX family protein [Candidatus Neptunochlamydia vexilliferae]|uniref:DoxX family protein n=1 Tax=Candidatus Neptunichlamydia vexilliferae TaxID=1651774 RepID=UPI001891B4B0|nr:DoxX family protein [Candidatus Neptunochlamydia vexilliferae]